ncbi:MAG TPA: hypothetical protein GX396_08900 [Tissierellia bacterium]|nr:hypothetical protein [Tissierellia bacterium]
MQLSIIKLGSPIGEPAKGQVTVHVPEEIIVYTEIKSADSKIFQTPYVEKDNDGIEQRYYKYVTNSPNIIISGVSDKPVVYSIERDTVLKSSTSYVTSYSENITLKEGINYFIITYTNQRGDTLVEEYIVEFDNKAPSLVILHPTEGAVAEGGKITVTGVTDPYARVTINNVSYDADSDGNFNVELDFGNSFLTKLKIEARDLVNNLTSLEINVLNDLAQVEDITLVPEYKVMATGSSQKLSTYISKDDVLGEKLSNSSVKYSIVQGSQYASLSEDGVLSAKYEGTVIVKSEFLVTDNVSLSDSIVIEITGDKYRGTSKYYPPVHSKNQLTWLAGTSMTTEGGTLKTPDGVVLSIPPGALPYFQDNVDILAYYDIEGLLSQMNLPTGANLISTPYYISLTTDLLKPAALTLPVEGREGYIYYFDENINALIYMGGEISSDMTVTAYITKPGTYIAVYNPSQVIFEDIEFEYWGYGYIYGLNYLDIINGYEESGKYWFKPEGKITRAEFVKLLVTAQNINISETIDLELNFADNDAIPAWAIPYIKAAVMHGLINGKKIDGKNYFVAKDLITREEIAAIIGRTIAKDSKGEIKFNDISLISSWAVDDVKKLIELGIITGYEDNTFRPLNHATRAEAAVMIYKTLLNRFAGQL